MYRLHNFSGCIYSKLTFNRDQILLVGNVPMKCAQTVGYKMDVRVLTDAEMTAWKNSQVGTTLRQLLHRSSF